MVGFLVLLLIVGLPLVTYGFIVWYAETHHASGTDPVDEINREHYEAVKGIFSCRKKRRWPWNRS